MPGWSRRRCVASKRGIRRKACGHKKRYATQAEALIGIRVLRRTTHCVDMLLPYACRFCGGFHFGHPPARVRQAIRSRKGA